MKKINVAVHFVPLFLSIFLMASGAFTPALHAQAPAAGTTVAVKMIDAVDSSKDPAGKQYRAAVTKAVDAGNGVTIPQGASAVVTLANSSNGSGWTAQLVSVTVNGQPVAVASSTASVTAGAQTAAGSAVSSINSMLGGFGHHVSAPSGVTAIAMGQRVVLPPGVTLSFVLSQPPAANPSAPAAPAAPAGQLMTASAAPEPTAAAAPAAASAGGYFISCSTATDGGIDTYYTGVFPIKNATRTPNGYLVSSESQTVLNDFYAYLTQKGYKFKPNSASACDIARTEAAAKAAQHKRAYEGGGCSTCGKTVETGWTEAASAAPEPTAAAASAAPTSASAASSSGGPFISCSTSPAAGIDTYLTGIFQTTRPIKTMPNGWHFVDQSILDHFYAYLTQKGYHFKPGNNSSCDVNRTEAEAKAAQHTRAYGGGGGLGYNCCGNGKIVETGWKDTQ